MRPYPRMQLHRHGAQAGSLREPGPDRLRCLKLLLVRFSAASFGLLGYGMAARADTIFVSYGTGIETYSSQGPSGGNTDNGPFVTGTSTNSFADPNGMVINRQGDVFVDNYVTENIAEFSPNGTSMGIFATGLKHPSGMALDQYGNLFVSNDSNGTIMEFPPTGGTGTVFAAGLNNPEGLAFDSAGNLYVSVAGTNAIDKINPQGQISPFATADAGDDNINDPMGLAFDASGNLYVANSGINTIEEFTPAGAGSVFASNGSDPNNPTDPTGLYNPAALAFDSSGDLYVANYHHTGAEGTGYSTIDELSSTGTQIQSFNDNAQDMRDANAIVIENSSGVPLLAVPEPRARVLLLLGGFFIASIASVRRRDVRRLTPFAP